MKPTDPKKLGVMVASAVAAVVAFVIVLQLTMFLSRALLLAVGLAIWAAHFVFNYVPVHFLASVKPVTLHPKPRSYRLRPIDAFAEVKSALAREYFAGKSWIEKTHDQERKELIFVCKYQEQDAGDKGVSVVDAELQLAVRVLSVEGLTFVQVDYRMSDPRPSATANEICKATTNYIESTLQSMEEQELCRQQV